MGEKEFGYSHGINCFGTGDNDYPLHKAVVDHDQNRIFTTDFWEVSDEVDGDLFEGERGGGGDWTQWRLGGMGVYFVLLAGGTSFNESIDVCG